ncbi:MAG: TetR/AcrR family transcriptional regulator [Bilifractor sp.]|jgi:AcrR family transcriptional regulator
MKQEVKAQNTRKKIMHAALHEFASLGYHGASINSICKEGGVAKGNLYHQFSSKEELYLACVDAMFQELTAYLRSGLPSSPVTLDSYFHIRSEFFRMHPDMRDLFCEAVIYPPHDLEEAIAVRRESFAALNREVLKEILKDEKLHSDLSRVQISEAFSLLQNLLNAGFRNASHEDRPDLWETHEKACRTAISIFLYGILRRPAEKTQVLDNEH